MLNKIILGVLLVLTAINVATYVQMRKYSATQVAPAVLANGLPCPLDPISECNDPSRFSAHAKYAGKAWMVDEATRNAYSRGFMTTFKPDHMGVFVSKKVLNKVFADDRAATGIVCTFGYDETKHVGLLIEAGYSDSTELSSPPTASNDNFKSPVLEFLGIQSAEAAQTSTITFSKIYCPPQCPLCDTCVSRQQ